MNKEDGSLISSYMIGDKLFLKTKGSLGSEQAIDAMAWLDKNKSLYDDIVKMELQGFTVNMEWTSPSNQIVLRYNDDKLIILNVINRETKEYLNYDAWTRHFQSKYVVKTFARNDNWEVDVRSAKNTEGYVAQLANGTIIKLKCEWYIRRHRVKDNVNNPWSLLEVALNNETDDIKLLFESDQNLVDYINRAEKYIFSTFNSFVNKIMAYHNENKDLIVKDFAIKGQKELQGAEFGVAMKLYKLDKNTDFDFLDFAKKNFKKIFNKDSIINA